MTEKILSFTEISKIRITDFSEWFKKRHPERIELLNSGDFIVVTGDSWRITVKIKHECNCEYCEENEEYTEDIENESDIESKIDDLMDYYEIFDREEFEIYKIFYIRAVRQNKNIGGLFKDKINNEL